MKFVSVDRWGVPRRFWCTSNIHFWPERYRRSQYTPRSSWRRRTHSSWYMRTTRRGMRLKDLTTVTTTLTMMLEATFPSTMESTHYHAMLLQASQPVSPPAIPPPPCRAESDLYKTPLFHLTYHWLLYVWRRYWPWFFGSSWCCFGVFFSFLGDEWLFVFFEYLWCVSIIYSKTMLQKFCKRHRCMSSKLKKIVRKEQAEVSQKFRSFIPCTYLWVLNWKKFVRKERALGSVSEVKIRHTLYILNVFPR